MKTNGLKASGLETNRWLLLLDRSLEIGNSVLRDRAQLWPKTAEAGDGWLQLRRGLHKSIVLLWKSIALDKALRLLDKLALLEA